MGILVEIPVDSDPDCRHKGYSDPTAIDSNSRQHPVLWWLHCRPWSVVTPTARQSGLRVDRPTLVYVSLSLTSVHAMTVACQSVHHYYFGVAERGCNETGNSIHAGVDVR